MLVDQTNGHLEAVRKFAERIGLFEQLDKQLKYLDTYGGDREKSQCLLSKDFAPYSFTWLMRRKRSAEEVAQDGRGHWVNWMNGGLIFHGPHDNHGDGGAPTYSVSLGNRDGWSIHT